MALSTSLQGTANSLFQEPSSCALIKVEVANNFDIYDPETESIIMECREEKLGLSIKLR
jgi:hypothetical protein